MEKITDEMSDAVLYRNLYTNILSQQINAENRLHRLISRQGQDTTFDEHFNKVRRKVEKDRIRIQKLGERLIMMEKKEMETVSKTDRKATSGNTKERKPGTFATLVNMESLRDQFKHAHSCKEPNRQMSAPQSVTPNQHPHQNTIDPKEIEVFFDNRFSQKPPNTKPPSSNATPMDNNQGNPSNTKPSSNATPVDNNGGYSKNLRNYPWFTFQVAEDDFPKRVSFNDIPDVIAEWEIGKERLKTKEEAAWNSDYSEDEPETHEQKMKPNKKSAKRYHEPPPPDHYSYQNRNRRNDKLTERSLGESPPKYSEARNNHEESWGAGNEQGNSPFGSPWEGVISTSLQRQRNDSTQAVPSSTTNNEVFLEELLLDNKTVENDRTTVESVQDIRETSNDANDNTTSRENHFKTKPKEETTNEEWPAKDNNVQEEINEQTKIYERVVNNTRDPNFIKDDALKAMRRLSWSTHPPDKKQQKSRGKLAFVFRRPGKKNREAKVIKADKKEFSVTKKVRRRMSLRPLPETPDVVEGSEHTLQGNTADSLDTFH